MTDVLVRGTVWLSLLAWVAAEWLRGAHVRAARLSFAAGAVALALHEALAMALRFGWSYEAALADAARQVALVTGRASADGFFLNWVFAAWWLVEAGAWWLGPAAYDRRPRALVWLSRAFFAFMFGNGAVVFGRGPVRAAGVVALLAVAVAWTRSGGPPLACAGQNSRETLPPA